MPIAALHPHTTTALLRRLVAGLGLHQHCAAGRRNNAMQMLQTLGAPPGPPVG